MNHATRAAFDAVRRLSPLYVGTVHFTPRRWVIVLLLLLHVPYGWRVWGFALRCSTKSPNPRNP